MRRLTQVESDWRTYKICMTLITFLFLTIGVVMGIVQYNYEIEKCQNMNSKTSNYDFDHKIELDAEYNQGCYYYLEHPLALFGSIFGFGFLGLMSSALVLLVWWAYLDTKHWNF